MLKCLQVEHDLLMILTSKAENTIFCTCNWASDNPGPWAQATAIYDFEDMMMFFPETSVTLTLHVL